jgi:type II secretory pathway pseudopilin PulG
MNMQQPIQIPEKNNYGYSFIEAMAALLIFSVGLLAIISLQASSSRNVRMSGDMTEATSYGTAKLEELMTLSYTNLLNPIVNPNPGGPENIGSGNRFTRSWSVSAPGNPAPNTVTITVNVYWDPSAGGGSRKTITLTSVKADMNL